MPPLQLPTATPLRPSLLSSGDVMHSPLDVTAASSASSGAGSGLPPGRPRLLIAPLRPPLVVGASPSPLQPRLPHSYIAGSSSRRCSILSGGGSAEQNLEAAAISGSSIAGAGIDGSGRGSGTGSVASAATTPRSGGLYQRHQQRDRNSVSVVDVRPLHRAPPPLPIAADSRPSVRPIEAATASARLRHYSRIFLSHAERDDIGREIEHHDQVSPSSTAAAADVAADDDTDASDRDAIDDIDGGSSTGRSSSAAYSVTSSMVAEAARRSAVALKELQAAGWRPRPLDRREAELRLQAGRAFMISPVLSEGGLPTDVSGTAHHPPPATAAEAGSYPSASPFAGASGASAHEMMPEPSPQAAAGLAQAQAAAASTADSEPAWRLHASPLRIVATAGGDQY